MGGGWLLFGLRLYGEVGGRVSIYSETQKLQLCTSGKEAECCEKTHSNKPHQSQD